MYLRRQSDDGISTGWGVQRVPVRPGLIIMSLRADREFTLGAEGGWQIPWCCKDASRRPPAGRGPRPLELTGSDGNRWRLRNCPRFEFCRRPQRPGWSLPLTFPGLAIPAFSCVWPCYFCDVASYRRGIAPRLGWYPASSQEREGD